MNRKNLFVLVCVMPAIGVLATACAPDSSTDESELFDQFRAEAPPFQASMLRDGEITPAEMEEAMIADRDCVVAAGYKPGSLQWVAGELDFEVEANYEGSVDPNAADARFVESVESCANSYSTYVSRAWGAQVVPSDSEREKLRPQVIKCLQAAGMPVSDDDTTEAIYAAINNLAQQTDRSKVDACLMEYPDFFRVIG